MTKRPRATINKVPVWCAHDKIISCVELKPNPKNPNTHPASQIELLGKIITRQGWRMPITVSNRSGLIVKGHARLEAAFKAGISKAPVDLQDYESEADEHADMVADNRLAELALIDNGKISEIMAELSDFNIDMELTGFKNGELKKFSPPDIILDNINYEDAAHDKASISITFLKSDIEDVIDKLKKMVEVYDGFNYYL